METPLKNKQKTSKDQGAKHFKAINKHRKQLAESNAHFKTDNDVDDVIKECKILLGQKEIFNKLTSERCDKTEKLNKKIYSNNLIYYLKGKSKPIDFNEFVHTNKFFKMIETGQDDMTLENARESQASLQANFSRKNQINNRV